MPPELDTPESTPVRFAARPLTLGGAAPLIVRPQSVKGGQKNCHKKYPTTAKMNGNPDTTK